ncbi:Metallo-peptidase family M12-domain-containing protein, partial [Hyaloraphidium curvatum]
DASLLLVLDAFNATFRFVLRPDSRVLHPRATWVSLDGEGRVQEEPLVRRVYRGSVLRERREQGEHFGIDPLDFLSHMRGSALGRGPYRAAFRGQFSVNGDMHHVLTSGHYRRSKREEDAEPRSRHDRGIFENGPSAPLALDSDPVIWRESDRGRSSSFGPRERKIRGLCAVADPTSSDALGKAGEVALHRRLLEEFGQDYRSSPLYRRSVSLGCPAQLGELMLYMTAVADCNYVAKYGGASQARDAIINTWARVSSIFESNMNIYIGLVSVQTFATCGTNSTPFNRACSAGYTITQRLSDFSSWRGTQTGNVSELSGLYHLVSTCATGPQVGIAWLNTLCQKNSFSQADSTYGQLYVSGTGVSAITTGIQDESKVVAHEIGHNFGSVHDCTSSTCPVVMDGGSPSCCSCTAEFGCDCREQFLMNPFGNRNFSTCTKDMMCQKLGTIGRCLEAPGLHETASRFVCGNGIREGSEQCDCGGAEACASDPCCNSNCTFKANATCSPHHDTCCTPTCQFRANGTLCRPSTGECDVAEYCTGSSGTCPSDTFVADGSPCNSTEALSGSAKCSSGQCTSRELQCTARNPTISLVNQTGTTQQLIVGECTQFGKTCSLLTIGPSLPGTECGDGGICVADSSSGAVTCSNPDIITRAVEWVRGHLTIVIPLATVTVLLLIVLSTRYC